jgi:enterochelin esterase-like enzyme
LSGIHQTNLHMNFKTHVAAAFLTTQILSAIAQPASANAPQPWINSIESPIVHPDRTVTFNFKAPATTRQVELSAQFLKAPLPLKTNDSGVWSVTTDPVEPNLYPYNFLVDGVGVADPNNLNSFPNEHFKSSLVDIPGGKPSIYSVQDVPHGEVAYCYYTSKTLGSVRPLVVYTPPGYQKGKSKYPVLYLISGTTDTEETWFKVGRANFILDNLLAQKLAVPMIIVMPYGNMGFTPNPSSLEAADMYKKFNAELTGDIIPYVESHYRVIATPEKRAIAGFSRGGGQTLFAAFSYPDKFAWVGSYSAYLTPEVCDKYFADLLSKPELANRHYKLLWMGVGRQDFLYPAAVTFMDLLKGKKIEYKNLFTDGGHTWMNARHYLTDTLQLYFK